MKCVPLKTGLKQMISSEYSRPTPESLLAKLKESERAKLRVYIGAAAGVGKTYQMLEDAHHFKKQGVDIVVAFVEPHGRADTEAMIGDLERVPMREIEYRGVTLQEMDVDAVIARRPEIAIVDELAHTNIPGSKHHKRYEDVLELLDAGISVITAVNIQHIESLNDVVARTTGVKVRETVPDSFLRRADEVVNVDVSVDTLRTRLRQGKIYRVEKIEQALNNFFRKGNLSALRELALRQVAEDQAEKAQDYREREGLEHGRHSRKSDGLHRLARRRQEAAARRIAHRRAAGFGLVRRLRRNAARRAGPHRPERLRLASGEPAVRRGTRREGGQAEGRQRRRRADRFRQARRRHARHLRPVGAFALGHPAARLGHQPLPERSARRDGAGRAIGSA